MIVMDRISHLPEPIQHHILSFLEQDNVVRATCLSKAWRSIVRSCPVLDFDQQHFLPYAVRYEDEKARDIKIRASNSLFKNHIQDSIQNLISQNLSIHRFSLKVHRYRPDEYDPELNRWVQQSIDAKVEDLRLDLPGGNSSHYTLPPFVLLSETITHLRLSGCGIDYYCNDVSLPNLLLLSLTDVCTLQQGMIEKFTSGSPKLESLQVIPCNRYINSVCVSGLANLNFLELGLRRRLFYEEEEEYQDFTQVKIIAPQLRVLKVSYKDWSKLDIDVCAPLLKKLTIRSKHAMEGQFESFVSKFHGLEELALFRSDIESIKISNQNLHTLKVRYFFNLKRVDINAPKLRVLKLSCCKKLERVDNINAPNLQLLKLKANSDSLERVDINALNLQVLIYNFSSRVYCVRI